MSINTIQTASSTMPPDLTRRKRSSSTVEIGPDSKRQKTEDSNSAIQGLDSEVIELSRNQRESPLLRLPAEIRNCIYEYVLGGLTVYPLSKKIELGMNSGWIVGCAASGHAKGQSWESSMELLYTCRDIYEETRLLPFKLNVFHIYGPEFRDWTNKLTDGQREAITAVQIYRGYRVHILHFGPLIPPVLHQCTGLEKIIRGSKLTLEQHRMIDILAQQMKLEIVDIEEASVNENGAEEYDSDEEYQEDEEDVEEDEDIEDIEDAEDDEEFNW